MEIERGLEKIGLAKHSNNLSLYNSAIDIKLYHCAKYQYISRFLDYLKIPINYFQF